MNIINDDLWHGGWQWRASLLLLWCAVACELLLVIYFPIKFPNGKSMSISDENWINAKVLLYNRLFHIPCLYAFEIWRTVGSVFYWTNIKYTWKTMLYVCSATRLIPRWWNIYTIFLIVFLSGSFTFELIIIMWNERVKEKQSIRHLLSY